MCGEHTVSTSKATNCLGSSPRVRGTRVVLLGSDQHRGIIPACAGNTRTPSLPASHSRDHPRVCGEHALLGKLIDFEAGSSPRVRGTRLRHFSFSRRAGIIPACAGNTLLGLLLLPSYWDHPRVCGEHPPSCSMLIVELGSSPRVRGTPTMPKRTWSKNGIIPACAGNTASQLSPCEDSGDHPRVCGEHMMTRDVKDLDLGSSPRVRGTPHLDR